MEISTIHSYLVNPEKGADIPTIVKGTSITKEGNMFNMLKTIFNDADEECKYEIAFKPNLKGEQQNDFRDLLIDYTKKGTLESGKFLAERLQSITTKRSGLGLLFLILGKNGNKSKLVISRFPADNGIVAEEVKNKLTVQFVERIFMKNAKAYKSAFYEGISYEADFWTGRAIDKQINTDLTISDYWIKEFLISDFATTSERGTKRLASALRNAINKTKSLEIKQEITAAVILAKGMNNKIISVSSFSDRLGLSSNAQDAIKSEINQSLFNEQFKLKVEELYNLIAFRTIELDNGAFLSSEVKIFDDVFQKIETKGGKIQFSTTGKIIDERIKKRK